MDAGILITPSPPLAPGQGRFLLAMKKHVFCCQCVII